MKPLIVALALVLGADAGGHEELLRRVDRLDEQLEVLLNIYDELLSCGDDMCMRQVKEKYIINGKYKWAEMVWGTQNTTVAIRKALLELIINELKVESKKNPQNNKAMEKIKKYESQYKKILEFEQAGGYD